jgi:hypothetical protein
MMNTVKAFTLGMMALIIASMIMVQPRFIGYDCNDSGVPQLAEYESDLTWCNRVEPLY